MEYNWFFIIFCGIMPLGVIVGMTVVLIRDHIKAKRRDKRCHQRIMNWWELTVK